MDIKDTEHFCEQVRRKLKIFKSSDFVFDEPSHTYTYLGEKFDSVTTYIKNFKEPFNSNYWAGVKAAERGITKDEILREWKQKADTAGDLGTDVHKWIEDFWNGSKPPYPLHEETLLRVQKFESLYESKLHFFAPIASEVKVFSKRWRLAGTIDQLFAFWDHKQSRFRVVVGDWKTNKEFKTPDMKGGTYKKLLRPFSDLYENHLSEYSIQLSLYRLILAESSVETDSAFLCHIGPNDPAKIYPAYDLRERLGFYLDSNRAKKDIFDV
jgi:hypothetical protein